MFSASGTAEGMITGLGVDVVEVARIRRAMKNPKFVQRILTATERGRPLTPEYVAGRWAAKEAIAKTLEPGLTWQEVEIGTEPGGKPVTAVRGRPYNGLLSITHEKSVAVAVAIAFEEP